MTERPEISCLLANVCRTMPYTSYIGISSYAVVFRSRGAAFLALGLVGNELVNHLVKLILKHLVGGSSAVLRRPESAADSGIYPQHYPVKSTTSGMPSGHAQTSAFCAVVLSHAAWDVTTASLPSLCYIWGVSLVVMASRTRFGSIFAVMVDGQRVAQHTLLQVVVGAVVGGLLGQGAAEWWYGGTRTLFCEIAAVGVVTATGAFAVMEKSFAGHGKHASRETELEPTKLVLPADSESLLP
uniref:Phosphatidic acid phosphatase type 2/haloperoxidase domain-containing protein n=1 Tax=Noctiluca scintillans TaxID=2966 RepID=A0A7S1ADK5_NOCSC